MNEATVSAYIPPLPNPFPQESDLYFKTYERPVHFEGKYQDGGTRYYRCEAYKAIVRLIPKANYDTTGEYAPTQIGMVGVKYKVLPMKELCQAIEAEFISCLTAQELFGVRVVDKMSYNGAVMFREYIFPNITCDIGSDKSNVAFRCIVENSYDGSKTFKMYIGAIDFFCTNGMILGIYDLVKKRHSGEVNVDHVKDKVRSSIDIFYKQAEQYKVWVKTEITDEQATEAIEAVPNISNKRITEFTEQYKVECLSHGQTVWALYSAATYYASHNEGPFTVRNTGADNEAKTMMDRETQIRRWLSTDEFKALVA